MHLSRPVTSKHSSGLLSFYERSVADASFNVIGLPSPFGTFFPPQGVLEDALVHLPFAKGAILKSARLAYNTNFLGDGNILICVSNKNNG